MASIQNSPNQPFLLDRKREAAKPGIVKSSLLLRQVNSSFAVLQERYGFISRGDWESVRQANGKPINDSMSTRSIKVGVPVPEQYYKKNYSNPQFLLLLKEWVTFDDINYFPIVFEGYYHGTPHWDLQKVEGYIKEKGMKYDINQN